MHEEIKDNDLIEVNLEYKCKKPNKSTNRSYEREGGLVKDTFMKFLNGITIEQNKPKEK